MSTTRFRHRKLTALTVFASAAIVAVTACSSSKSSTGSGSKELSLVAYSVPKPAYDALQAGFAKTSAGSGVTWKSSYGASGTQSKNVSAGTVKADYVAFSVTPDLTKLVPKFVASGWDSGDTKGIVSDSVVVIVVRKGNPLGITGWDDLTKSGVKIVTPDPASSGSAKWNLLAAYEHTIAEGGSEADAKAYLTKFYGNVVSRATSGATALTQFTGGTGDVLISYENEAIAARQAGKDVDYIVPPQTVLIENPAAVTVSAPAAAKDFLSYILSPAGQEIFVSKGYRPAVTGTKVANVEGANDPANPFPTPSKLITIDSLGGWTKVNKEFFDTDGIITNAAKGS